MWRQTELNIATPGRGIVEMTRQVNAAVSDSSAETGLCHLFLRHTSASLILCENADPSVRDDLQAFAERFAPDGDSRYRHCTEGPDDMPAHLRSIFVGVDLTIPISGSSLALGTWQGLYLWEHRTRAMRRQVVVTISGEKG